MARRVTLNDVQKAAKRVETLRTQTAQAEALRDRLALQAYEQQKPDEPVTYNHLAEALGVTRDRVNQVFRAQRRERVEA